MSRWNNLTVYNIIGPAQFRASLGFEHIEQGKRKYLLEAKRDPLGECQ